MTSLVALALAYEGPIQARSAMVTSPEPLATDIGVEILRKGGNAFDAAAAVGFALAVTFPDAGNIGGGGFAVGLTSSGTTFALDFRETAPAAAHRDMFLDSSGEADSEKSTSSHLAAGVPGSVDGLLRLHERYGKLSRSQILAPAERLAKEGFVVSESLSRSLGGAQRWMAEYASTRDVFYKGGSAPRVGSKLVQSDLGKTLARIRAQGRDGFYRGAVAELMERDMKAHGGLITRADLANYRSKWRMPVRFQADGMDFVTMPLPSSGGLTLAQVTSFLDWDRLKLVEPNSYWAVHHVTEALRLGFEDRNRYYGDPDYVSVPVQQLLSPKYLASRRKMMPDGRAGRSHTSGQAIPGESHETTHYAVVDRDGNVCAVTTTLNGGFGLGAVATGAGFLWNNEMDDFTSKPGSPNSFGLVQGEANSIEPGKRMLSSMTPTIVLKNGKFWLTVGSPGGPTIITTVLQTVLNSHVWGMDVRTAVDSPRFHHQHLPDQLVLEAAMSERTKVNLRSMGYDLNLQEQWGEAAAIRREPDGSLTGWFDRRGSGKTAGD